MGYKEALQFLGRDGTEVKTEPEEIKVEGKHAERVAPSNMLDNPAPVPEAETNKQELEATQLTEESTEYPTEQPLTKEPVTKPGEQDIKIEKGQAAPTQIGEIEAEELAKPEAEAMEGDTDREGDLRESGGDEATPDFDPFLGSEAADELEPERATLAAATIRPFSLLGSKKGWVWIVVLVCLAIAAYFLLEWYSRRGEVTSLPREAVKTSSGDTVRDFLDDY